MGFFDFLKKKKEEPAPVQKEVPKAVQKNEPAAIPIQVEPDTLYQPLDGDVIPLIDVPDPVFTSGALGWGCGIIPAGEIVYAPVDGVITTVADTKHAIGMTGPNDMEILIHVGIDTVKMNGKGFEVLVKEDEEVKAGTPLLTFSKAVIAENGFEDTTVCLIINAEVFKDLLLVHIGPGQAGEKLITYKE